MRNRHRTLAVLLACLMAGAAVGTRADWTPLDATDVPAAPASALIKLPSGITLHYAVQGRADGAPMVLLHGVGDSWRSFEPMLRHIPDRFRVYAVTLRGHGWSDKPEAGYGQAHFAADIRAFLAALDLDDVTLVGHSLGSFVAQRVAVEEPARTGRLVLIGSGPGGLHDRVVRQEVEALFGAQRDPIDQLFARDFQASTIVRPVPAPFFETMSREILLVPSRVWHEVRTALHDDDTMRRLGGLECPILAIWGDRDSIVKRPVQEALLGVLPRARLAVYEGVGHAVHWEEPARVAADLVKFAGNR